MLRNVISLNWTKQRMFFTAMMILLQCSKVFSFSTSKSIPNKISSSHSIRNRNTESEQLHRSIENTYGRNKINSDNVKRCYSRNLLVLQSSKSNDNDNNKNDKNKNNGNVLGGTTATQKLFSVAENFGKIASLFQENNENNEEMVNKNNIENSSVNIESIAEKIKEEYEAIFWAVSTYVLLMI